MTILTSEVLDATYLVSCRFGYRWRLDFPRSPATDATESRDDLTGSFLGLLAFFPTATTKPTLPGQFQLRPLTPCGGDA